MDITRRPSATSMRCCLLLIVAAASVRSPLMAAAQLTGALIVTVKNEQGADVPGALIVLSSSSLIGGPLKKTTDGKGPLRFPALPPGSYVLDIEFQGSATYHEKDVPIRAGIEIERSAVAVGAQRVDVHQPTLLEARQSGFATFTGPEYIKEIPTRRSSFYDILRADPGISPTSPASSVATTVSIFGSATNENQFLIDGTNTTCPCSGIARSELAVDFIGEVHVQSVGASAEFGNMLGGVININTRSGSERFLSDLSYYGQAAALTGQPVRLPYLGSDQQQSGFESGFERAKYLDVTATLGGPAVRDRLWFFGGYQHLRDNDSQPGTDPGFPRSYETEKIFGKLTWRLSPAWNLVQSFHDEIGVNPDRPTIVTPFEATRSQHISVPAMTFGHLTHTMSANTLWDVRVGRFVHTREDTLNNGNPAKPSVFDRGTGVTSGAPPRFVSPLTIKRTTGKATLTHYRPDLGGAAHEWKIGGQLERGEHDSILITPTGEITPRDERYELRNGMPLQAISAPPSHIGGMSVTASAFATDTIRVGDRLTINAGVRFDHSRAISQDLHAIDHDGRETEEVLRGLGTLYTWNQWSPRLGIATKLSADGRTMLRASYGRFFQGLLTGEYEMFHPGATAITMTPFVAATGGYTGPALVVDPKVNLQLDPDTRAPRTDEYSIGVDRAIGRGLSVAVAFIHKDGSQFIGWEDVAGQYVGATRMLADGSDVQVFELTSPAADRRFRLTNPAGNSLTYPEPYSLTYNGLVMAAEKRRSHGWQASGSYTLSRVYGLLPSSGVSAAGEQASTVSPPQALVFGRDPNDLTNARGRLPNDRPHMFKVMGSADVPRTGFAIAASLQHYSGKPWAAATQLTLPQGAQRIQLEPRGSRRLSSQTLLDLRLSRPIRFGTARIELFMDVLNLLNDTAEESLATETLKTATVAFNPTFGQPASFVDPRRAMFGARLNLGR